ncbi:caldesmon 1a isoform X4 [Xiphophorus couchianus]|uniref:caldesmon 1a isoform X4 n=1 Tax=Xiphophorus couchianus TaxID=32473 RepID=UPI001016F4FC|nr:non-muscle caldesmon-like isoform X4 [Xiphophorus couchianus]
MDQLLLKPGESHHPVGRLGGRFTSTIMEDMDFERRRELRRQKREEMRLEAERMLRNDDDEEEAARERRRRARQERLRSRESEEPSSQPDGAVMTNSHSVTESVSVSSPYGGGGDDEEQALQERMAKREERRQRRMKEALERQKQLEPAGDGVGLEKNSTEEERPSWRSRRYRDTVEDEEKTESSSSRREEKEQEEPREEEEEPAPEGEEDEEEEEEEKVEVVETKPRRSNLREQASAEETVMQHKVNEREESEEDQRKHNGGLHDEAALKQHRKPERTLSRGSVRSPEVSAGDEQDDDARLEAERKLEELKRRRDDAESEEFERMRQKQQEAEAELEELKRKREERKKVLEEEERQRKQEEAERKAREEEEKRKMKEEIERRRAEAAEKRQKVDDIVDGEGKPFKCVSPRGSSLKIGERAEFLNKSAQKSSVKASHSPVVSKIDNRLEQYTSAAQRENKESKSPRSTVLDLPMVTDVRNIKSMWEKGNVFSSPGSAGSTFKEAAVIKTGVAGRINDWLNKTLESGKTSGGKPTDLKPVDVTNKRSLWENKGATPTKMAGRGETKSVANGMGH